MSKNRGTFLCGTLSLATTFNVFKPLLAFVIILDICALPLGVLSKTMPRYCLPLLSTVHCLTIDIDIRHLGFHCIVVHKAPHNLRFFLVYSTIISFTSCSNPIDILLYTITVTCLSLHVRYASLSSAKLCVLPVPSSWFAYCIYVEQYRR